MSVILLLKQGPLFMKRFILLLTISTLLTPLQGFASDDASADQPFTYNQSTQQAFYFFNNVTIDGVPIAADDWVVALNGEIVVGARLWDTSQCGNGVCEVPTMGDDGSELTTGYLQPGEIPTFKIYDTSENTFYEAVASETIPSFNNIGFNVIDNLQELTLPDPPPDNDDQGLEDYVSLRGDVNGDGDLNVLDVVKLVNTILQGGDLGEVVNDNQSDIDACKRQLDEVKIEKNEISEAAELKGACATGTFKDENTGACESTFCMLVRLSSKDQFEVTFEEEEMLWNMGIMDSGDLNRYIEEIDSKIVEAAGCSCRTVKTYAPVCDVEWRYIHNTERSAYNDTVIFYYKYEPPEDGKVTSPGNCVFDRMEEWTCFYSTLDSRDTFGCIRDEKIQTLTNHDDVKAFVKEYANQKSFYSGDKEAREGTSPMVVCD